MDVQAENDRIVHEADECPEEDDACGVPWSWRADALKCGRRTGSDRPGRARLLLVPWRAEGAARLRFLMAFDFLS